MARVPTDLPGVPREGLAERFAVLLRRPGRRITILAPDRVRIEDPDDLAPAIRAAAGILACSFEMDGDTVRVWRWESF